MSLYNFKDKHVLITGATGGLGSALVRLLASAGARLVITARSDKALDELTQAPPSDHPIIALTADLTRPDQTRQLARRALAQLGHIDVLINNAGIGYYALMREATEANLRHLFELNTIAPLLLIQELLPRMTARGHGRIITIGSCAGRIPIPSMGVYGASKTALTTMTNTLRMELAPQGIAVINIYPGTMDTAFEENALREEERPGLCPRERCGRPRTEMAQQVMNAAAGPPGDVWLERAGKWMSAAALLSPRWVDHRLAAVRDKIITAKSTRPRRWKLLQVESTLACNLRCIMCPWRKLSQKGLSHGIMSPDTWEAIRPHLPQIESIDFTGGGEPLLQPHLVQWVSQANQAGCETGLLTNGMRLTPETALALINAGIDWIGISIDGADAPTYNHIRQGADFTTVCKHVAHLAALRPAKQPKLMLNFVLMQANVHQLDAIVRLAAELGIDQINFKQCDVIRAGQGRGLGLFGPTATKTIRRLEARLTKARRRAAKLGLKTTAFAFTPQEQPVCDQDPTTSMFIRHDGAAAPCINQALGGPTTFLGRNVTMPAVSYGRLDETDLETLWASDTCRYFQKRFKNRIQAYDAVYVDRFIQGAAGRDKTDRDARQAMPAPPKGCEICHYLYNI